MTSRRGDSKPQESGKGDKQSGTSIIVSDPRLSNISNSRDVPGPLSQDRVDPNRMSTRKTIILLDTTGTEHKSIHAGNIHTDKGYSRTGQLSVLYATMLGLFGFVFPVTEALNNQWLSSNIVGAFFTYLFACASVFILYIEIYEVILRRRHQRICKTTELGNGVINPGSADISGTVTEIFHKTAENDTGYDNQSQTDRNIADRPGFNSPSNSLPHEGSHAGDKVTAGRQGSTESLYAVDSSLPDDVYEYLTMHHGMSTISSFQTNYFLKAGLLLFAVANMVYVALRIEGEHYNNKCIGLSGLIYPHYVHLAFIGLQTFFLTKECKLALRKHKAVLNFGLMHLAATNMCIWFRNLVIEVAETVHEADGADGHVYTGYKYYRVESVENITTNSCLTKPAMAKVGPYLFPFILEYSLVAMTTLIVAHGNINIRLTGELYRPICAALHKKINYAKSSQNVDKARLEDSGPGSFDKSHKGLTLGGVVLAGVIVSMVLFFYWKGIGEERKAQLCYTISEIILLALIAINTVVGMYRLFNFIYNSADSNTLDHALLLISANFLLVMELFSLLSVIFHIADSGADGLLVAEVMEPIISIIQAILQVAFINDGMQRVSVKDEHVRQTKGRGIITFLIVLNATMWLFESFQEKKSDHTEEIETYGKTAWAVINSLAHPLEVFFYFHSAICLSQMWHHCYKNSEHDVIGNKIVA